MIARWRRLVRPAARRASAAGIALLLAAACGVNPLSRKYEYEEEVYVDLDGSATVYVNASVPALVTLRGVDLPVDPAARLDRQDVRAFFESPVTSVANVTTSRRDGRRYVHVRIEVDDIRRMGEAPAFAWSSYRLTAGDASVEYRQAVGPAAGRGVADVGWQGSELVAFRLHLPSRVTFHNSPTREIRRGNIIVWEQLLAERQKGVPIEIDVRMDSESILASTLLLFGTMIVLVAITFVLFIWFIKRRGEPVTPA
ncbi:MAG: hypothetical protein IT177_20255 [Acidobacteria bacterium]|nr:hypothetical protein [Acidobacteriota bacterium]